MCTDNTDIFESVSVVSAKVGLEKLHLFTLQGWAFLDLGIQEAPEFP